MAPKWLFASFRWRPITLAGNNLTMRVSWQPEADCGVGIIDQAFKASSEFKQIAANVSQPGLPCQLSNLFSSLAVLRDGLLSVAHRCPNRPSSMVSRKHSTCQNRSKLCGSWNAVKGPRRDAGSSVAAIGAPLIALLTGGSRCASHVELIRSPFVTQS